MTRLSRFIPLLIAAWICIPVVGDLVAAQGLPGPGGAISQGDKPLIDFNTPQLSNMGLGMIIFIIWLYDNRRQTPLEELVKQYKQALEELTKKYDKAYADAMDVFRQMSNSRTEAFKEMNGANFAAFKQMNDANTATIKEVMTSLRESNQAMITAMMASAQVQQDLSSKVGQLLPSPVRS